MATKSTKSDLPQGTLDLLILKIVALGPVHGYSIAQHARTARAAGLGLDEISSARGFASGDGREAALLAFLESLLDQLRSIGADFVQTFPAECVPMERGRVRSDLGPFTSVR